jgi:hypothetical protein
MRAMRTFGWIALLLLASTSFATTPNPTGITFVPRIWDDCPISNLTLTDTYPGLVVIQDENPGCGGYANLHGWRLAIAGMAADFPNDSAFRLSFTMTISGTGNGEAGLQITPWWSQADGRFNVRTTDGEIACFGGRLPFYSFTGSHGVVYQKGNSIYMCVTYLPRGLTAADPATIEYRLFYNGSDYSSGALPFDEGNPAEDPPHGVWGILNYAQVGGYMQYFLTQPMPPHVFRAEYADICFQNLQTVRIEDKTWGHVKGLFQ